MQRRFCTSLLAMAPLNLILHPPPFQPVASLPAYPALACLVCLPALLPSFSLRSRRSSSRQPRTGKDPASPRAARMLRRHGCRTAMTEDGALLAPIFARHRQTICMTFSKEWSYTLLLFLNQGPNLSWDTTSYRKAPCIEPGDAPPDVGWFLVNTVRSVSALR